MLKKADCRHEPNQQIINTELTEINEESYLKEENKLLKLTIADKDVIISDKIRLINLLEEKITYLENKLTSNNNHISNANK